MLQSVLIVVAHGNMSFDSLACQFELACVCISIHRSSIAFGVKIHKSSLFQCSYASDCFILCVYMVSAPFWMDNIV